MLQEAQGGIIKVFFALWPSASERSRLAAWQAPLVSHCGGRATRVETFHCTLVFLGDIAQSRLESLQLAAQEVHGQGFELRLSVARYWGHNHIVYAAPAEAPNLLGRLVTALEQSLSKHGFKFDQRGYRPHVTLIRKAQWQDIPLPDMRQVGWHIDDFALVQSRSRHGVADYRVLARFPLDPAASAQDPGAVG
jgi:2'-5' RNA ligase